MQRVGTRVTHRRPLSVRLLRAAFLGNVCSLSRVHLLCFTLFFPTLSIVSGSSFTFLISQYIFPLGVRGCNGAEICGLVEADSTKTLAGRVSHPFHYIRLSFKVSILFSFLSTLLPPAFSMYDRTLLSTATSIIQNSKCSMDHRSSLSFLVVCFAFFDSNFSRRFPFHYS